MSSAREQAAVVLAEAAMLLPDQPRFVYRDEPRPHGAFDIGERFEAARAAYANARTEPAEDQESKLRKLVVETTLAARRARANYSSYSGNYVEHERLCSVAIAASRASEAASAALADYLADIGS